MSASEKLDDGRFLVAQRVVSFKTKMNTERVGEMIFDSWVTDNIYTSYRLNGVHRDPWSVRSSSSGSANGESPADGEYEYR